MCVCVCVVCVPVSERLRMAVLADSIFGSHRIKFSICPLSIGAADGHYWPTCTVPCQSDVCQISRLALTH